MNWHDLIQWPAFQSVATLAPSAMAVAGDVWMLGEHMYLFTVPYNERAEVGAPGAPFVTMVAWAESKGAIRRALLLEIEEDAIDRDATLPLELMPASGASSYGQILTEARHKRRSVREYASYRIATDGAFIDRAIECGQFVYCFRSRESDDSERPYAIKVKLGT
jgi:hypothetical protein